MVGLYIHIPFCARKCGYCDFASYAGREDSIEAYLRAVVKEARRYEGERADTVFIGGGTPSFLPEGAVSRLMEGIGRSITIASDAEMSIEANPDSLTLAKAREYIACGINRISIGLQAAQDALLQAIGRLHSYRGFLTALENARKAGFIDINADLMYALPGQSVAMAEGSAMAAASLPLTHISAYALKLEPDTPMYGLRPVDEDTDRQMFHAMRAVLEEHGFARYEISNFALPGHECAHNLKYWRRQDYIGLGAAAHSCYGGRRYGNERSLSGYISMIEAAGSAVYSNEAISPAEARFEEIMLRTRLTEGIEEALLPSDARTAANIAMLEKNGLAERRDGRVMLTAAGMDVQNAVVLKLTETL